MTTAIELRHLRYFIAVSEELNFGRAALRLHISQPPLSRQIRQLETLLGVDLFERNKHSVALTAAGKAFLPAAVKTLAQLDLAVNLAASAAQGSSKRLQVGCTTVFDHSAFPQVKTAFEREQPGWTLTYHRKHSILLIRDLLKNVLDIAFVGLHTATNGLNTEIVREERFIAALSSRHPLAGKRKLSKNDLVSFNMFWFDRRQNPGFYDRCQSVFEQIGFNPPRVAEPSDHHVMLGLIAEGEDFALLPASLKQIRRDGVVFRELNDDFSALTAGIVAAWRIDNQSAGLEQFLRLVRGKMS